MTIEKAVGQELCYCRTKKGLSQEKLGFEANLHHALNQRNRIHYSLAQFESLKVKRDSSTSAYLSY